MQTTVITAITGAVGLGQRFNEEVNKLFLLLQTPNQAVVGSPTAVLGPMGPIVSPTQIMLSRVPAGQRPIDVLSPVDLGTIVSETMIANFRRTQSILQMNTPQGWGLGALIAFIRNDSPQLVEFDGAQFHPELKGLPDPARGDRPRVWRSASMGSGQMLADSFLAHAYRLLFGDRTPTVDRAQLVVSWTLDHVIRYNTGGIGGDQQMAILERNGNGAWEARYANPKGEVIQQLDELEQYISAFRRRADERPDSPDIPDAKAALQIETVAGSSEQGGIKS